MNPGSDSNKSLPIILRASDVVSEKVNWLWQNRIPNGKMTMFDGDPGHGKSWLSLAVASAVTLGQALPGQVGAQKLAPANVLLLAAEDGAADTIRPRLEAMGADLERVNILVAIRDATGNDQHLSLVDDLDAVGGELEKGGYGLVIIDPLNAYLGTSLDTHRDSAMRAVLTPLARLAEKHCVALVCIRHLTKSGRDKAIYRGQGSIAYTAAARVAHLVGVNPDDESERVIVCVKNNLAQLPPSFAFEIKDGCFLWKGETDVTVDTMLKKDVSKRKGATESAKEFLLTALAGGKRPATKILEEAKKAGIAERTLKRARAELQVKTEREGGKDGFWLMKLPEQSKEADFQSDDGRPSSEEGLTQAENTKEADTEMPKRSASIKIGGREVQSTFTDMVNGDLAEMRRKRGESPSDTKIPPSSPAPC